jgi:hypothetical protein
VERDIGLPYILAFDDIVLVYQPRAEGLFCCWSVVLSRVASVARQRVASPASRLMGQQHGLNANPPFPRHDSGDSGQFSFRVYGFQ